MKKSLLAYAAIVMVLVVGSLALMPLWSNVDADPSPEPADRKLAALVGAAATTPPPRSGTTNLDRTSFAESGSTNTAHGTLRIRARYAETDAPAALVPLEVTPNAPTALLRVRQVVTDSEGRCEVLELPLGPTRVCAMRSGTVGTCRVVAGRTTELALEIPAGVTVRGIVINASDTPVMGAKVWLSRGNDKPASGTVVAEAKSDGSFELQHVAPGRWLSASAEGHYAAPCRRIPASPGDVIAARLVLRSQAAALVGRVYDERGEPVAEASVMIGHLWPEFAVSPQFAPAIEVRTDEHGQFRADGLRPSESATVWISAPDFAPLRERTAVSEIGDTFAVFHLARAATLTGIIVDPDGRPVEGVTVVAQDSTVPRPKIGYSGPAWAGPRNMQSDGHGAFTFHGLTPGRVLVTARTKRRGRASFRAEIAAGETASCQLVLRPGAAIRGSVRDKEGRALPGWQLTAQSVDSHETQETTTADDGSFAVSDLEAGPYTIAVVPTGSWHHPILQVRDVMPGGPALELVVEVPSAFLIGTFSVPGGESPKGALITADNELHFTFGAVTGDGRFKAGPLPAGSYLVTAESRTHGRICEGPFSVTAGATTDTGVIELATPGSLTAHVQSVSGQPVSEFRVSLSQVSKGWNPPVHWPSRFEDGIATARDLAPGRWLLQVGGDGVAPQNFPFRVKRGEEVHLAVEVLAGVTRKLRLEAPTNGAGTVLKWRWFLNGKESRRYRSRWSSPAAFDYESMLIPGSYLIEVTDLGGRQRQTRFVVDATPGPGKPIRVATP